MQYKMKKAMSDSRLSMFYMFVIPSWLYLKYIAHIDAITGITYYAKFKNSIEEIDKIMKPAVLTKHIVYI